MKDRVIDIAIVGGGLAGGLIALALAERRPALQLALIERGPIFGGNHIWSFFGTDVDPAHHWLVEPLIAARWDGYQVRFPGHSRALSTSYRSVAGERLDARLRAILPSEALLTGCDVASLAPDEVTLADGRVITANAVIDARGPGAMAHMTGGWQKFLGQMLVLDRPHGLDRPVIMDARVEQHEGYRFIYCLPFSPTRIFVEDTYYSTDPALDMDLLRARIRAYADASGWKVNAVEREETGVLPVIAGGDFDAFWRAGPQGIARAGSRAALFHPVTSYSLPAAVCFAIALAGLDDLSGPALARHSHAWAKKHWHSGAFYRKLSQLLFGAAAPERRYKILERFYTMPEGLIERFYAERTHLADKGRILAGKPPVPIAGALASLSGRGYPLASLGRAA